MQIVKDKNNFYDPESKTIHYDGTNDEFIVHELGHYLGNDWSGNDPYAEYSMKPGETDFQPGKWYADIEFLQRDPNVRLGDYYDKSEVANRVRAAKYRSQGNKYTKEFFRNLRASENKYGDNMRDLLHMYNDETLEKIFGLESYKRGGKLQYFKF